MGTVPGMGGRWLWDDEANDASVLGIVEDDKEICGMSPLVSPNIKGFISVWNWQNKKVEKENQIK